MSIIIDEFRAFENELVNNVLYFALGDNYSEEVSRAKSIFNRIIDENNFSYDDKNFTSWLLWNYKLENGSDFFKEYLKVINNKLSERQRKILISIANTYLSIYEIVFLNGKKKLVDIFSKKEVFINEELEITNSNQLIIGRIAELEGQNYILDEYSTLDRRFQNGIEKVFHENFERYKEKNGLCNIEEFIKDNSILINSFTNIIDDIRKKQLDNDEEYCVYQSNYAVLNNKKLCDAFEQNPHIELDYKDSSGIYYIMYRENKKRVLCEIALSKDKLELECVSYKDRDKAKILLEEFANGLIEYMNDEIITLDDVI